MPQNIFKVLRFLYFDILFCEDVLLFWFRKCQKMVEKMWFSVSKRPKRLNSKCLLLSTTTKNIQFTARDEQRNLKIFTFNKLNSENYFP